MSKKEFSIKASSLNFWWYFLLFFIYFFIGIGISTQVPVVKSMFWPRNLLALSINQILFLVTVYFTKYDLKILFTDNEVHIFKNSKLYSKNPIDKVQKFHATDINNKTQRMGGICFFFEENKKFHFMVKISSKRNMDEQSIVIKSMVQHFITEYSFVKQDYCTNLGKSENMFMYVNPKYIKDE